METEKISEAEEVMMSLKETLDKNRSILMQSAVDAGIDEGEFAGYIKGETMLIHTSKQLQLYMKKIDPETYLLETNRPMYAVEVRNAVILAGSGSVRELAEETGVPRFHCLLVIKAMGEDVDYGNGRFEYVGHQNVVSVPVFAVN